MESLIELRRVLSSPTVVLASIVASLLALVLPLSIIQVYDRVIPQSGLETLVALCAIGLLAALLEFGLKLSRGLMLAKAGARFELQANMRAVDALFTEDPARAPSQSHGEVLNAFGSIDRLREVYAGPTSGTRVDVFIAIIFLGFLFAISPSLALFLMTIVMSAFIWTRRIRRRVRRLHDARLTNEARRQSFLTEVLSSMDTVRALHIEPQMQRRYDRLLAHSAEITDEFVAAVETAKSLTATVGMSAPLLVTAFGASLYLQGHLTMGLLAATVILAGRIIQPILQFESYIAGADSARDAERDFHRLIDRPRVSSGAQNLMVADQLRLNNVTSVPDPTTGLGFSNVSATFQHGTCTHIVAPTAQYASMFLRLLAGEVAIERGQMLLNDAPFEDYVVQDRRSAIRILSAQNRLLEGTLLENISNFGGPEARAEASDLAKEIGLDAHIAPTIEGYDMRISHGERGPLPRSLVEAAGIVAALASDPNVILLDEANAALDIATDKLFIDMIRQRKANATIVMVTQRPSLAKLCDQTLDIGSFCMTSAQGSEDESAAFQRSSEASLMISERAP